MSEHPTNGRLFAIRHAPGRLAIFGHRTPSWFRRHLAEDAVIILGGGRRLERDEPLALARKPSRFWSLGVRGVTVRLFGGAAQVDADAPWELANGRPGVSRFIDTPVASRAEGW